MLSNSFSAAHLWIIALQSAAVKEGGHCGDAGKSIQYHSIPCPTIPYNTIPNNTIRYNAIQFDTKAYNSIQYHTIRYNTIQIDTIPYNFMQYQVISSNIGGRGSLQRYRQAQEMGSVSGEV